MKKSFNLLKILSRLNIRGVVHSVTGAPAGKYEDNIPKLGADNRLDPSVVPAAAAVFGDVSAENVDFGTPPEQDGSVTNVRDAINNITKDAGGLALMRSKNLTDVADPDISFNNIKQAAEQVSAGNVLAGVLGVADNAAVLAGTDTATDTGGAGPTYLAVPPSLAKSTYLSKVDGTTQTMAGALILSGDPDAANQAATKDYVDTTVAAAQTVPTGNTLWVDIVNGNNVTAQRGLQAKPFATLTAAKTAAQSGDLIVVRPGTFNENDLAKNGVSWYFMPGAKVLYTSGGSSSVAVFNIASNETCNVLGHGDFRNMHSVSSDRFVLRVASGGKTTFEALWVQSARTAIYVDVGATGYAQINIQDSLRSDALDFTGSSAAILASGNCHLNVGREIFSYAAQFDSGLQFGTGALTPAVGTQIVRCPRIIGVDNAINFNSTERALVYCDVCTATDGAAVKVSGGTNNILVATAELATTAVSSPAVLMTKGRLTLQDTVLYALNEEPGIYMNSAAGPEQPYLILNNCQLWTQNFTPAVITANIAATYKVRILGSTQADTVQPPDVIKLGGTWDVIAVADA